MAKPAWLDVQGKTWDKKRRNKPSLAPWDRAGTEAALGAGGKCKSTSWDRGGTSAKPEQSEGLTLLPVCCPPTPPLLRSLLTPSLSPHSVDVSSPILLPQGQGSGCAPALTALLQHKALNRLWFPDTHELPQPPLCASLRICFDILFL